MARVSRTCCAKSGIARSHPPQPLCYSGWVRRSLVFSPSSVIPHQILARLEKWSEKDLFEPKRFKWMKGEPFERYIAGDSYEHYVEHAEHIEAWRRQLTMNNDQ